MQCDAKSDYTLDRNARKAGICKNFSHVSDAAKRCVSVCLRDLGFLNHTDKTSFHALTRRLRNISAMDKADCSVLYSETSQCFPIKADGIGTVGDVKLTAVGEMQNEITRLVPGAGLEPSYTDFYPGK